MKQNNVKLTLREMLHYLNAMEEDRDIYVDGLDSGCAVCGGDIRLTHEGMKKFGPALDLKLSGNTIMGEKEDYDELDYIDRYEIYGTPLPEGHDGGRLIMANRLIFSLAGYCSVAEFKNWFEGPNAKLI